MAKLLGHRQTKGAETDKLNLPPPRHISTLLGKGMRKTMPLPLAAQAAGGGRHCRPHPPVVSVPDFRVYRTFLKAARVSGSRSCRLSRGDRSPGPEATGRDKGAEQHQPQCPGLRNSQIGGDLYQEIPRGGAENEGVRAG
jgi:hypothetical protein